MLAPYRVIDCSNENGLLCGQLLADLGADVIQVEPPSGSSARGVGPWLDGRADRESSLFWWAYTRNKRGIALDLESPRDFEVVRKLIAGADFFIESDRPGRMAELGLGYADLAALNPALVYVSISPFGQTGPKAQWLGTDLTQAAAGAVVYLSGEGEMPPVRVCVPQAHAHAGADAAVGALLAHFERKRSGRGQHVDVSMQQSITLATMFRSLDAPLEEAAARRVAGGGYVAGVFLQNRFALRDGWVTLGPCILPSTGHFMTRLLRWVAAEGHDVGDLPDRKWGSFARDLIGGKVAKDSYEPLEACLRNFFETRTRAEVIEAAVEQKLLLAPILDLDEIMDSEQLSSRDFLAEMEGAGPTASARYPGPFAKFSQSPIRYRLLPPALDEHGDALRSEGPRVCASAGGDSSQEGDLPLAGVKVLDLFWILAGPGATRMLADYGATVVHVESARHLDTLRVIPPYQFNLAHVEGSGAFQCANANKLGITLDLSSDEGREAILELVRWADVVTESFAAGVIDHYKLGWDVLREVNPSLIMISSCLMGQTGPWRDFTGFGNLAANVTGFQPLASWPDRPPAGPYGAYTDFIAVRYNALSILAALEHRDRTGEGQYIDQSQAEAALHFLAPAFLDYSVNGVVAGPCGNDDSELHPHGVFPCEGSDRWVAIAVRSDDQWRALCGAMERPDLLARRDERALVDEAIAKWTQAREPQAVAEALQALAVPAHAVFDTPDLYGCPQMQHRGHYLEIEHEIYQTSTVESTRLQMSRSQARAPRQAMSFGRDNREVLEGILGYSPERIADLAARGVLL